MNFSNRMGIVPQKAIQIQEIDQALANGLWNVLRRNVFAHFHEYIEEEYRYYFPNDGYVFFQSIWLDFLKENVDDFTDNPIPSISKWFQNVEWYSIYDFIEFIISSPQFLQNQSVLFGAVIEHLNIVLEREVSAYRIVNRKVVPITNPTELEAIEKAINTTGSFSGYDGTSEHLTTALVHLSDHTSPDYRNSIKESISAVESIVGVITGNPKDTLGAALKKLKTDFDLHEALKEAFSKLYGYASDEGGIRHALTEGSNAGFEEAKFMLVTCSAFINYVAGKYGNKS